MSQSFHKGGTRKGHWVQLQGWAAGCTVPPFVSTRSMRLPILPGNTATCMDYLPLSDAIHSTPDRVLELDFFSLNGDMTTMLSVLLITLRLNILETNDFTSNRDRQTRYT